MRITFSVLAICCSTYAAFIGAQPNFRADWQKADPVDPGSVLSLGTKVKTHQMILEQATLGNNSLKQLYGFLYLFEDYLAANDFPKAAEYLLEAETLVKNSGNPGWQGFVSFRRGVLNVHLKDYKKAISCYESAAILCGTAGDSACLGESFGQISSMYGQTGDYTEAHRYFELALPLIARYGSDARLASLLHNYGNLLINQGRFAESIPYIEKALITIEKVQDLRQSTIFRNNLALANCHLHRYEESMKMFQQCILMGEKNNWREDLIYNYEGISIVFEQTGRYRQALAFYQKFRNLQDSLIGSESKNKIADLETRYYDQQKELILQKKQNELSAAHRNLERIGLALLFLLLLVAFGLWRWRSQSRLAKSKQLENQENLTKLTRILLEKNKMLKEYEEQLAQSSHKQEDPDENIYNQRILTSEDWIAFKSYFNKAYPGYVLRLRTAYPTLSDAELRLFLFIKLNLSRNDAAIILGISPASVKKTRYRLRQRLGLAEGVDLDAYILNF